MSVARQTEAGIRTAVAGGASPLLERSSEAVEIDHRVAALAEGQGSALLIAGPAGIGKSRLLDLAAARDLREAAALAPLRRALDLATSCGATALATRARNELGALGVRPRREPASGLGSLTAAELRVARMAAAGQTNRDIAQALFVSLRTVETHLTHAYRKLEIPSRAELGRTLDPGPPTGGE